LEIPNRARRIDGSGHTLAPGLIDLQINGAFGRDFTLEPGAIWDVAALLPRYGLTSFLPTIITSPLDTIEEAQQTISAGPPAEFKGARPLGLHLEGPYLNPEKKGAHNPEFMRRPALDEIAGYSPRDGVSMVTLAPELYGALPMVDTLSARGILVSAGHSQATFDQAKAGFEAGIRYSTHLFNAMSAIHHREPGLASAALADERVTIGLIPDGIHVHPALIKVVWQVARDGRLNLVTDAMAALGMPPGRYQLGGYTVTVDESSCRLPDGTLAGCIISPDQALRNLIAFTGCSLTEALAPLTTVPAQLLSLGGRLGQITRGHDADLVLLTSDLKVAATVIGGRIVFQA
jgi:N-acetylglucosamine-6-phosphate deacetylase